MNPLLLLLITIAIYLSTGCATVEPQVETVYVNVPVYTPLTLPTVPQCDLKTPLIDDTTSAGHIAQAYVHDLTCLKSTDGQLRQVLEAVK